jgi:anti-anti-sigma regulatory factor
MFFIRGYMFEVYRPQVHLHVDAPDACAKVRATVDAALRKRVGAPRLRLVLHGTTFPAKTIAELIRGLRRLREHGGAIELTPASGGVRATLALTGLDRVFRVIPLHEPTFVRRRLRHPSWRQESRASLNESSRQRRSPCSSQAGGGT